MTARLAPLLLLLLLVASACSGDDNGGAATGADATTTSDTPGVPDQTAPADLGGLPDSNPLPEVIGDAGEDAGGPSAADVDVGARALASAHVQEGESPSRARVQCP